MVREVRANRRVGAAAAQRWYVPSQRERLRNEDTITLPVGTPLEEVERQMIMRTLQKTKNNKTRAAELLGISLKTLHNKINLYRERGLLHDD